MKKLSQQLGSTIPFLTVANNKKKRTSQIGTRLLCWWHWRTSQNPFPVLDSRLLVWDRARSPDKLAILSELPRQPLSGALQEAHDGNSRLFMARCWSGRRGKLPSPVPHRSGHARLAHPAPHIVALLREYSDAAIRRAGREYFLENRVKRSQVILLRCERRSSHWRHIARTS